MTWLVSQQAQELFLSLPPKLRSLGCSARAFLSELALQPQGWILFKVSWMHFCNTLQAKKMSSLGLGIESIWKYLKYTGHTKVLFTTRKTTPEPYKKKQWQTHRILTLQVLC